MQSLSVQRLCDYLRTERPVLLVGSPKCKSCWVFTNKGDAANPLKATGTRWVFLSEQGWLRWRTRECASSTFAATPPLESLKVMLSRCMTGKRRTPAEEKVLGFYDISRAHLISPARRTIVIKVPKEDDECTSGYAVLDKAMYETKDAAQ